MRIFELNGKTVKATPVNYNLLCELSANGIEMEDLLTKPIPVSRAYVAACLGTSVEIAGKEIEEHIINDGKLDDILAVFYQEVEESAFFRKIIATAQKNVEENPTEE